MASNPLTIIPVPGQGAEDVLVDPTGHVWTGTDDGSLWRIDPASGRIEHVARTGGRPLGLEWLPDGRVLVCDADRGLLAVDAAASERARVERLVGEVDGSPMLFCNNAAVAADGRIFFSDTSRHYSVHQWKADLLEATCTGRLLVRHPDGTVDTLLDGLEFANGVALAADESYVAVAETGARTVVRLWLGGPSAGTRDLLADELPGYPDNIARGSDGLIWVALASPRDPVVETLKSGPALLRKAAWRLPERVQPKPQRTVHVQALDDAGTVVHDCEREAGDWHMATGVREHEGRVWLGSLVEPAIGWFDLAG